MNNNLELLLSRYTPTQAAIDAVSMVKTLFIVGISGAGKDTIQRILLETGKYHQIVSHTTRSPRKNHNVMEKDGVEYYFISLEKAEEMLKNHEFIEAKYYSGNIYGTSIKEFEKAAIQKKMAICDIEIQGVMEYRAIAPDTINAVFLLPPSYNVWQQRWEKRWGTSANNESKKIRMQTAIAEIEHVLATSHYFIVVNDDLDETVKAVDKIAETGFQDDVSYGIGRKTAEEILQAMKSQVGTL